MGRVLRALLPLSPVNTMKFLVSWIVRFVLEPGWIIVGRWKWRKQVEEDGWMEYNSAARDRWKNKKVTFTGINSKILSNAGQIPALYITLSLTSHLLSRHLSHSHSFANGTNRRHIARISMFPSLARFLSLCAFFFPFFNERFNQGRI